MTLAPTSSRSSGGLGSVALTGVAAANKLIVATDASNAVWAALASGRALLTAGGYTTTSTTFVDVDATNAIVTITTGARRCLIVFSGLVDNLTADAYTSFDVAIDTVRQGGSFGLVWVRENPASNRANPSFSYLSAALSAGAHTFKLQWRVSAGTAELAADANGPLQFSVIELPNT